jgi:hypothetical protein
MVGPDAILRKRSRKIYALLAAAMLLTTLPGVAGSELPRGSQGQVQQQPPSADPFVIQGRITGIQGNVMTVKTPNGYPGGPGGHPQFVTAGPSFRIDVSRARVLFPDGRQVDPRPLAAGDRVLIVLTAPNPGSPANSSPRDTNQIYAASIIERIVQSDNITTH